MKDLLRAVSAGATRRFFGTKPAISGRMAIILFKEVSLDRKNLGGKAWGLAVLSSAGFAVPEGVILTAPLNASEHLQLLSWWEKQGRPALAVRSSAAAEDSAETSFAGQNKSFLKIKNLDELQKAISDCFESRHREASEAYRKHFSGENSVAGAMNVVVQVMVDAEFAGVFFSRDPRTGADWILEVIHGLGEDLVSGKVTPGRFLADGSRSGLPEGFTDAMAREVAAVGLRVAEFLHFPVDMEWAIGTDGQLRVLQARPITTLPNRAPSNFLQEEFCRIKRTFSPTTTWDGQTFAEWSGLPSPLTLSIWRTAFSPHHAFGDALQRLGYASFDDLQFSPEDSLLDSIFGRAFINLERLADLYYGPAPYSIVARPRPHTQFDWRKIRLSMILHFPQALLNMFNVALNVSARRKIWLDKSKKALSVHRESFRSPVRVEEKKWTTEELITKINEATSAFTKKDLVWPLLLVVLTESTVQTLRLILSGILGEEAMEQKLREWMAAGVHTVTMEMADEMKAASFEPSLREIFLKRFGHRGPGEMDLANPRWSELGERIFQRSDRQRSVTKKTIDVEAEIKSMKSYKKDMVLSEWRLFSAMLTQREEWKMEILKPYAEMRQWIEQLGNRSGLGEKIHWLMLSELVELNSLTPAVKIDLEARINLRQARAKVFRNFSLPEILSFDQLEAAMDGKPRENIHGLSGQALSPGVAYGEVRVVEDPAKIDLSTWPENVILVAESTDPGWTPLFLRAKGILVEHGGVLSHCAIVAREMSIPAVSGIQNIKTTFHDRDRIWIDGNTGRVSREGLKQ